MLTTDEQGIERRLLGHVVRHLNEDAIQVAGDAMRDLLAEGDEEFAGELLTPVFEWSSYWPEELAKAILGIESDVEVRCADLLMQFEAREEAKAGTPPNWTKEGF